MNCTHAKTARNVSHFASFNLHCLQNEKELNAHTPIGRHISFCPRMRTRLFMIIDKEMGDKKSADNDTSSSSGKEVQALNQNQNLAVKTLNEFKKYIYKCIFGGFFLNSLYSNL